MFLFKGKRYATAAQVAVVAGAKRKPCLRVKQGVCGNTFFYQYGKGAFDYAGVTSYELRKHGGLQGLQRYLESIDCKFSADRIKALAEL